MVALKGRINIRCTEERVARYDQAAAMKGMTRSEFMLKACDVIAEHYLGAEKTKEVPTSKPVPEVVEKVRLEPTPKRREWMVGGVPYREDEDGTEQYFDGEGWREVGY